MFVPIIIIIITIDFNFMCAQFLQVWVFVGGDAKNAMESFNNNCFWPVTTDIRDCIKVGCKSLLTQLDPYANTKYFNSTVTVNMDVD